MLPADRLAHGSSFYLLIRCTSTSGAQVWFLQLISILRCSLPLEYKSHARPQHVFIARHALNLQRHALHQLHFCFSLFAFNYGKPLTRSYNIHEFRASVPTAFVRTGPATPNSTLSLQLALVPSNLTGLHKTLHDVSDPASPLYGQHLSKQEAASFVAPKPESLVAVNAWLAEHGIEATAITPAGDWLSFSTSVETAAQLLNAEFSRFVHQKTGKTSIRTLSYSIPADLKDHVDLVHPTISFFEPRSATPVLQAARLSTEKRAAPAGTATVPAACASPTPIRPQCLQELYGIPSALAKSRSNHLAVVGYNNNPANLADLRTFLTDIRPDLNPSTTFTLFTVDGGSNPQNASLSTGETNFDTQYTVGLASGVPIDFIAVAPESGHDPWLDTATFLLNEESPPHVVTTSYAEAEDNVSRTYAMNICNNLYAQLGARGTSLLFASGDGGVGHGDCTTFVPTFPNHCPFVTSVGATTGFAPETAASFSSGGFSNYFARPGYQNASVLNYLSALGSAEYAGLYNRTGRGFPDVSAQGVKVEYILQGTKFLFSGTSCASPIFASVVALLNDERITAGKSPLGFLNMLLYGSASSAFTDVTTGNNPGCGTDGFPAKAGWDPVTGLGTPNFAKLKAALG
ncbi:family S53 protease [Pilatotrama ljubarskyi]|nr:family S53 protease [Pilatotrama ljubarskyi]